MQQEQKNIELILNQTMVKEKIAKQQLLRENLTVGVIALIMLIFAFFGKYIGMDLFGRIFVGIIGISILFGLNVSMDEPEFKSEKKE